MILKSLEESIPWTLADSRSHEALVARSVEDNQQRSLFSRDVKTMLGVEQKESSKAIDASQWRIQLGAQGA